MSVRKSTINLSTRPGPHAKCGRCPGELHVDGIDNLEVPEKAKLLVSWLNGHKCTTEDDE